MSHSQKETLDIQSQLPRPFINYLWQLSAMVPESDLQVFVLSPNQVAGKEIQEITHSIPEYSCQMQHRVYGFKPFSQVVLISKDQQNMVMSFSKESLAAAM